MRYIYPSVKPSLGRLVLDTGLAAIVGAALFRWIGPDYHASPLALEWAEGLLELLAATTLVVVGVRYARGVATSDRLAARVLLIVVTFSLLAVIGEQGTRLAMSNVSTSADVRSYFSRRWGASDAVAVNSLGFREREFPMEPAPNVYRVAVVGDSFTWGNGARTEDRLTDLLQKDCAGRGCEVLNFGTPGNATPDNTSTLKNVVLGTRPDFVLLAWFTNDPEATAPPDRPPHFLPLLPWPTIERDLYGRSALFALMKIRWADLQLLFMRGDPYVAYMRKRFEDPHGTDAQEADTELRKFIETCKSRNIGVGIVLWPHLALDLGTTYPLDFLHQQVLATCADEHIPCVDLRPAFAGVKDRRTLYSSPLDTHPGLLANQIAEQQVLNTFGQIWQEGRERRN